MDYEKHDHFLIRNVKSICFILVILTLVGFLYYPIFLSGPHSRWTNLDTIMWFPVLFFQRSFPLSFFVYIVYFSFFYKKQENISFSSCCSSFAYTIYCLILTFFSLGMIYSLCLYVLINFNQCGQTYNDLEEMLEKVKWMNFTPCLAVISFLDLIGIINCAKRYKGQEPCAQEKDEFNRLPEENANEAGTKDEGQ